MSCLLRSILLASATSVGRVRTQYSDQFCQWFFPLSMCLWVSATSLSLPGEGVVLTLYSSLHAVLTTHLDPGSQHPLTIRPPLLHVRQLSPFPGPGTSDWAVRSMIVNDTDDASVMVNNAGEASSIEMGEEEDGEKKKENQTKAKERRSRWY